MATPPMTDTFAATFDTVKWPGSYGGVANVSGRCRVPCTTAYPSAISSNVFDLTLYPLTVEVPTLPVLGAGGTQVQFNVRNGTNLIQFQIQAAPRLLQFLATGQSTTSVTYDSVAHRWLQVDASGGSLTWKTSPDGATWTTLRTIAYPTYVAASALFRAELTAGYFGTETAPGNAEFDNFNLPVSAPAAPLSGTGSLTVSPRAGLRGTAALSGSGALTPAAKPAVAVSAPLAGAGALTSAPAPSVAVVAGFGGGGTLAVSASVSVSAQAALSSAGILAIAATATTGSQAALTGSGALAASGSALTAATGAATLTGTGTLGAGSTLAIAGTVTLAGAGVLTLSVSAAEYATTSAALAGAGTLTSLALASASNGLALSGTGVLDATTATTTGTTASLSGLGLLEAFGVALITSRYITVAAVSGPRSRFAPCTPAASRYVEAHAPTARIATVTGPRS